jgi:AraC-like DNA-binding protein
MIPFMHIGIAFAFFTIIYFLTRRPLKLNEIIASLFLFFLALPMLIKVVNREAVSISMPEMLLSIGSYPFLYGPFLYLYTKFEISEKPVFKKLYLLHFLPFIISIVIVFFFPGLNRQAQAVNLKKDFSRDKQQSGRVNNPQPAHDGRDRMPPPERDTRPRMPQPDHEGGTIEHHPGPGDRAMMPPPRPGGPDQRRPPKGPKPGDPHSRPPEPPGPEQNSLVAIHVPGAVTVTYFITYTILILLMLRKHKKNISEYFSYYSFKVNLTWLRWLTICFVIAYVFVFLSLQIKPELFMHPYLDPRMTPDIALAFFVLVFSFFAVKQPEIFTAPDPEGGNGNGAGQNGALDQKEIIADAAGSEDGSRNGDRNISVQKERRYEKSGLKESDARNYLQALERYMRDEKPYLDSELTIVTVSERLGIPRHYLTQVINEYLNKNFFVYINEFRVSEAKLRMSDENFRDHTILRIAYDSGFNSKSGFNIIFKKHTGYTPTEYRNSCG